MSYRGDGMILLQGFMTSALNAMSGQFYVPAISVQSAIEGFVGHRFVIEASNKKKPPAVLNV
jgi:K+ transporter